MSGYSTHHLVPSHSHGGGGLALLWKKEIEIEIISSCQNFIDTLIRAEGKTFYGTFLYGEPDISKRKLIWSQLIDLGKTRVEPWFITRDFNDIIESSEKQGGLERPDGSLVDLRSFMS